MHRNTNPSGRKLYVILRGDLTPGMQLAQTAHAVSEFALTHPDEARSTPIGIVLQVPDERALLDLTTEDGVDGTPYVLFHEEDLNGEATALATVSTGEPFSSLPLAGRIMATT